MKFQGRLEGTEVPSRATRIEVTFEARVSSKAGEIDAQICNLSASGFRLRSSKTLEPGSVVTLQVGKLPPVKALVRWARGEEAGGVFVEPMAL